MFVKLMFLQRNAYIILKFVLQNKKMKKILLCLGIALLMGAQENAIAQKQITEGVVIYDLKIEGGEDLGMMAAMLPTEMTVKFKGTKSRAEFATGMSETIAINDNKDNKSGVVLLDVMGNKYAMKIEEAKLVEQKAKMPIYDALETKETKVIAGYTCKKVILINQATKEEVSVFYTPEIPYLENSFNAEFKVVKGMPMEYVASMNNIKMTVTVREVKKEKIADTEFTIPAEYKITTQEELMKEFGGMGGE